MEQHLPQQRPAPRIGLVTHSIDVFSPEAKDRTEAATRAYFAELLESGAIAKDSLLRGRILLPTEAMAVADEFAAACVDLVVLANVAFSNGQVFLALATNPYLARIPLAVAADPEPSEEEWASNAWCGVIMHNHVAKQIGRPLVTLVGPIGGTQFKREFERLLRVAGTIKMLRKEHVARFGDAPSGFHSASGDQLAFAARFGTRVDTIDLTAVMETYRTGRAVGYLGESTFTDNDVRRTADEVRTGRDVAVDDDMLTRGVRLYHAFRAIIRANGYTSCTLRCWPEVNEEYIGISTCLAVSLLMGNGDVTGAACEGDWPTAVTQTMGTGLSGSPAVCVDWVNYTGGSEIVQLGHCGAGCCGHMAEDGPAGRPFDMIAVHPVLRQGGKTIGPVHVGQFKYGVKTGICMMRGPSGRFRLLAFKGESSAATAKGMMYSAADVRVPAYPKLNRLVLEYGFPHHLAMAFGDITEDLRLLCRYLGIEYVSPE
jgi:L-fucose isomerase-like protein